jgi:hypothetical protein
MRLSYFLFVSFASCAVITGALLSQTGREVAPLSAQEAPQPVATQPVATQGDQAKAVDPRQIADWQSKARNLLDALDTIERSMSAALPHFEADKADDLVRLVREYKATFSPIRTAANKALAGDYSPELRARIVALNNDFQEKGRAVQEGIVAYNQDIAKKHQREAENFQFMGIGFSTKPQDLRGVDRDRFFQHPWGETHYWDINLQRLAKLDLRWVNGELFEIVADYGPYVYDLGGSDAIVRRLTKRLGSPSMRREGVLHTRYTWNFPEVERRIVFDDKNIEEFVLSVVHTGRKKRCQEQQSAFERKEKAAAEARNAGF